jgi:hypothetical protein
MIAFIVHLPLWGRASSSEFLSRLSPCDRDAASSGALNGYMALCRCDETRFARSWTRGHAFWTPESSGAERSSA